MRLGVLRNPVSTGNRGRPPPALPGDAVLAETRHADGVGAALARLAAAGAEAVVIDGGDGTVREAVTHLGTAFAIPPPVAILPHGNTNLVAARLGALRPRDLVRLAAMTCEVAAAHLHPAPVMRIEGAPGPAPPCAFIAGWGAYAAGTRIASAEIATRRRAQVLAGVLATLRRSLVGPDAARLRRGVACEVVAEGHALPAGRRFLGLVTALQGRLMPPLDPFWGAGAGPLRFLDIAAPPRRLALAAPFVAVGRPRSWMARAGYRAGRSPRLTLVPSEDIDLILDGDVITITGGTRLTVSARERVNVLHV